MKRLCLVSTACGLCLLFARLEVDGQEGKEEVLKPLQGTWQGWVVEGKGVKPEMGFVHLEVVVKGDTITARRLEETMAGPLGDGTFRLSVSDKKKTIDATRTSAPAKGRKYLGLYEIDGDTWRWCVANPGLERPTELLTKKGQFLLVLKRK